MRTADAQEEQFEETCALVREVGFDRVNTAAYSPRPSTPAALWDTQVADLVKADRLHRLNRLVNEVAEERAQRFVGSLAQVGCALLPTKDLMLCGSVIELQYSSSMQARGDSLAHCIRLKTPCAGNLLRLRAENSSIVSQEQRHSQCGLEKLCCTDKVQVQYDLVVVYKATFGQVFKKSPRRHCQTPGLVMRYVAAGSGGGAQPKEGRRGCRQKQSE